MKRTEDDSNRRDGTGQGGGYIGEQSLKSSRDRREWDPFDLEDLSSKDYLISVGRKDEG